jgi:hypothetical protein
MEITHSFQNVGKDITLHVFSFLPIADLKTVALVSKNWRAISEDLLWGRLVQRDWTMTPLAQLKFSRMSSTVQTQKQFYCEIRKEYAALIQGRTETIEKISDDEDREVQRSLSTPVAVAAILGLDQKVRKLLHEKIPEKHLITAFHEAIEGGHVEVIKSLLDDDGVKNSVIKNLNVESLIIHRFSLDPFLAQSEIVDLLLPLIDKSEETTLNFLLEAAEAGLEKVLAYFAKKTDEERKTLCGGTDLHQAIWRDDRDAAQQLIMSKKELDFLDNNSWTPLHLAVVLKRSQILKMLLALDSNDGFHPNIGDNRNGDTPLHWAINRGFFPAVEYLCAHKNVNVNSKNADGSAPIHRAILKCDLLSVNQLLKHNKLDCNIEDNLLRTPLKLARELLKNTYEEEEVRDMQAVVERLLADERVDKAG